MRKVISLILLLIALVMLTPSNTSAITLGEHEASLRKYEAEAKANKEAANKTETEIKQTNKNIDNIKQEMLDIKDEVVKLNEEIVKYNVEIEEKIKQSKNLLEYLQLSDKGNSFLEYIFNADSVTDLIYRTAVVQEITEYNNKMINDLKGMIDGNKKRQLEIDEREKVLAQKEKELSNNLVSLGEKKTSLGETAVSVSEQIKQFQDLVDVYKKLGCKSSDVIGVDCAVQGDAGIFRRPTQTGYVTSEFGWRSGSFHRGLDVGSSKGKGEKIYPVADGRIVAKYTDFYGALCVAIEHYSAVKGQWYTSLYAHLSSYAPGIKLGDTIKSDQYIGYMGDTGYAFGVHLHFELAPCRYLTDSNCNTFAKYSAFIQTQANNGFKGPRALINFPSGTWKTR